MKPIGIVLIVFGLILLICYCVARRRLKMKEEDGDGMVDKVTDEITRDYGVPRSAVELTPERLRTVLNIALSLIVIGIVLLCYARN
jgi:hypothetical protein